MRGSHKSRRVSWASDENLRQVRLFLSEDSPSQVGLGVQDHLQAKKSWLLHSTGGGTDDHLPPGFEDSAHSENQLKKELSQISLVKWQCPPRFFLDPHWQVVAGQESKEGEIQNQREMRVLEAVYPRPSAIPPSPSVPLGCDNIPYDDRQTPLIPVTPIEDEDTSDPSFSSAAAEPVNNPQMSQLLVPSQTLSQHMSSSVNTATTEKPHGVGFVPGVQPDAVAAASAAFSAIMKTNEQASMIDPELLIQILNNPKLIEKLVSDYGPSPANGNLQNNTTTRPRSPPLNLSAPQCSSLPVHINRLAPETSSMSTMHTGGHYYPVNNAMSSMLHARPLPPPPHGSGIVQFSTTPPIVNVPPPPPPVRDMYYYKSLIQQHGGERSESENHSPPQAHLFMANNQQQQHFGAAVANQEHMSLHNSKQRETGKSKINKPCMYFNSSRGCKNGANCGFQHDPSFKQRMPESQHSAKRMKLDREITGRT
ncbi:hypothetical protein MKX01_023860 [Papaver californicum]|nr:hypothetical protein MKX01_023860 [Papaver californicum]